MCTVQFFYKIIRTNSALKEGKCFFIKKEIIKIVRYKKNHPRVFKSIELFPLPV